MTVKRAIEVLRREGTVWLSEIVEAERIGADALLWLCHEGLICAEDEYPVEGEGDE